MSNHIVLAQSESWMDYVVDSEWASFVALLPSRWQELAKDTGAIKQRLRSFNDCPDRLFRTLMLHVGCGLSLKETAAVAAASNLSTPSSVALFKRLKSAREWFRQICAELIDETRGPSKVPHDLKLKAVDGSIIREPGKFGSSWRLDYCLSLSDLSCDQLEIVRASGKGSGESLKKFKVDAGDCYCVDAGYARAGEICYIDEQGGYILVRNNFNSLNLFNAESRKIDLTRELKDKLTTPGQTMELAVFIKHPNTAKQVAVRICVQKRTEQQTLQAQKRARRKSSKNSNKIRPETLELCQYLIVVTTIPAEHNTATIFELYRLRWQVELVFKRLKSLTKIGHLPKRDPDSSRAWLYGKLIISLLAEKTARLNRAFSPSEAGAQGGQEHLARVLLLSSSAPGNRSSLYRAE